MRLVNDDQDRPSGMMPIHTGPKFSRQEGREVFREMVRAEMRNGYLSPTRRKRLIQYAAAFDLTPIEAGKIVTEVYRETVQTNADAPVLYRFVETAAKPHHWPIWLKLGLAVLAAVVAGQVLSYLA